MRTSASRFGTIFPLALATQLALAQPAVPYTAPIDSQGELALGLFAEREMARNMRLPPPPYVFLPAPPERFNATDLERRNRALYYWLWAPRTPPWPPVWPPVWPPMYPVPTQP